MMLRRELAHMMLQSANMPILLGSRQEQLDAKQPATSLKAGATEVQSK